MGNTTENIPLPSNQWVNISDASNFPYGKRIVIENVGVNILKLSVNSRRPEQDTAKFQNFYPGGFPLIAKINDFPVWAYSANTDGAVNVREALP